MFCTLETPRTVVANMRVLEHVVVGEVWRLVERIEVAVGSCILGCSCRPCSNSALR